MRRRDDDRGAVVVLFTLSLVALLILSSIVVDLGLLRVERRANQGATDQSALAAGAWLSGRNDTPALARPQSACQAALAATKANLDEFPAAATIDCTVFPALGSSPSCTGATAAATAVATGTGPYTLSITYPVPASQISEPVFSGGSGIGDGPQCERMEVALGYTQDSLFAGVLGVTSVDTEVTAVVRGGVDTAGEKVPALLLLERTECRVLTNSANGAGNLGIIIGSPASTEGGSVHIDTLGLTCGSNTTDYAIYGDPLSGGGTSITVEDSSGGVPGTITSVATAVGNPWAAAQYPGGISHAPTPGDVVSRGPADLRYNPSTRTAITDLHAEARTRVLWSAATATANGYTVLGCGDHTGTWTDTKVFVDCAAWGPRDVLLPNATDVVTAGKVDIANNRLLYMPVAERFYVRGCPGCTGNNFFSVNVAGELYVNTGSEPIGSASCANRNGPGAGGTTANTTRMVLFGSPIKGSGEGYLCQTTGYLAEDTATYTRHAQTSGWPNCTTVRPCPVDSVSPGGHFDISGYFEWTAPSQNLALPSVSDPFEDLGMWSESSDLAEIKSGGELITSGVFFLPNARIEFRSPASGVPRDAQWVVRSFQMLQGTLRLTPNPDNSVGIPSTGVYGLIR